MGQFVVSENAETSISPAADARVGPYIYQREC